MVLRIENQGYETRPRIPNRNPELPREVVAERGCADLWNREAAGCHDQRGGAKLGLFIELSSGDSSAKVCAHNELRSSRDLMNLCVEEDAYAGFAAFVLKHLEDVAGRAITKHLSKRFFVIGDPVLLNQGDEIGGCVTRQGGLCEVWIRGKKIFRAAMNVCEIAAASARDENLFAQPVRMVEYSDAASALAGFDGAHQASGAAAKDQCI